MQPPKRGTPDLGASQPDIFRVEACQTEAAPLAEAPPGLTKTGIRRRACGCWSAAAAAAGALCPAPCQALAVQTPA